MYILYSDTLFYKHIQTKGNSYFSFAKNPGSLTIIQHLSEAQRKAEAQMSERLVLWE